MATKLFSHRAYTRKHAPFWFDYMKIWDVYMLEYVVLLFIQTCLCLLWIHEKHFFLRLYVQYIHTLNSVSDSSPTSATITLTQLLFFACTLLWYFLTNVVSWVCTDERCKCVTQCHAFMLLSVGFICFAKASYHHFFFCILN